MYLLIQSPGEAVTEAFTLLGASGSRDVKAANGQFGTGNKLAITQLLRGGYKVRVYCGRDRLVFGTRKAEFENQTIERVTCSINGRKATDCGWTLDWGCVDWTSTTMALREFVANALDASIKGRGYKADLESGDLVIKMTQTAKAKAGYTRVYIECAFEPDLCALHSYLHELPRRFLHFSDMKEGLLPKANRSLAGDGRAMIYRMGVYVCSLDGTSVYDYNLGPDEIQIDECRNSNEYSVRAAIARRIRRATADELVPIFKAIGARQPVMESRLDPDYILPSWKTPAPEETRNWQNAWKTTFNEAIMTDSNARSLEFVQQKGYGAQAIDSDQWRTAMGRLGIKSDNDVLSPAELRGRTPVGAPVSLCALFTHIWNVIDTNGIARGKNLPLVGCFQGAEEGACKVYVENGTVFVREDLANNPKTVLQGITEYVTESVPLTSKYESFIFDLATALLEGF